MAILDNYKEVEYMPSVEKLKADQDDGRSPITGVYRARVESNLDPLKLGRIKVRVPQLHGVSGETALSNDALPWAFPVTATGTGYNHGSLLVPETGDYVFILFENGDRNSPVYLGGCYGIPNNSKQYGNIGDNPDARSVGGGKGWSSPAGVNEVPNEVYPSGGNAPNGKVIYKSPKGFVIMTNETDNEEMLVIGDNDNQQIVIHNPSDDNVSDITIMGKDGQTMYVRSTSSGEAEVAMTSPTQVAKVVVTDEKVVLSSGATKVDIIDGKVKIEGDLVVSGTIIHG